MIKHILLLFLLTFYLTNGQQNDLQKGIIIDSISVLDKGEETYALYMPDVQISSDSWPVVFVFDPLGRGKFAAEKFIEGADINGYLIVASNTIRNGTYEINLRSARRLFEEVNSKYPIDQNRIYTAGFSGGARLAVTIATVSNRIKGVIACGASFASNTKYIPKNNTFSYIGIIGEADFNLNETLAAITYLEKNGFDAYMILHDGGHEWPSSYLLNIALRRFTVKAMNKNLISKDSTFLANALANEKLHQLKLEKSGRFLHAYNNTEGYGKDYRFYVDSDSLKTVKKTLRRNKQFKKQRSELSRTLMEELYYIEDYKSYLEEDIKKGDLENLEYWEGEVKSLDSLTNSKKNADLKLDKRIRSWIITGTQEAMQQYDVKQHPNSLLFGNILLTLVEPTNVEAFLNVIQFSCKNNNYGMALYYTEKLFENGFKDENLLREREGTALLRIMPEYIELKEAYLKQ